MNIQATEFKFDDLHEPNTFVEATVLMANCYKKAIDAAIIEDDLTVRKWIDASRKLKKYISNYKKTDQEQFIKDLEKSGTKNILGDALNTLKSAEPFVEAWVNRFAQLNLESYSKFNSTHWDIFLDFVVPLSWDWESDLFVLLTQDETILEKLIQRGHQRFIIIEPELERRRTIIKFIAKIGLNDTATVVPSKDHITRIISTWITNPPQTSRVISTKEGDASDKLEEELQDIDEIIRDGMVNAVTLDTTIRKHDLTWVQNGLGNFIDLANNPHASCLNGKFSGYTAVIISPGPSLEKNIEYLKQINGKAIIIAGSHSLQYLREKDIIPHIILHVDPNVSIDHYFEDFELEKVELLVLCATTAPALFKLPVKRKTWIYANAFFDNWLMKMLSYEDFAIYGSCVSVAAFKLAIMWGCSEVTLVGQDLSFGDGKYYAGNTQAPDLVLSTFSTAEEKPVYRLPGYYGGEVLTKNDYRMYHQQFQDTAKELKKKKKIKLYNSTEGGALIEGFKNIPLRDFIDQNLSVPENKHWSNLDLDSFLQNQIELPKVRNNLIKAKRHLVETEKLIEAGIKKFGDSSSTRVALQKKISRKLKQSMLVKMALQDELEKISSREDYKNSLAGYEDRGKDMYDACIKVIKILKVELSKIKI